MESNIDKITEMESEIIEQSTDREVETGEKSQDNVKEIEDKNPGETVREENSAREDKDSPCPMFIEEGTSLGLIEVTTLLDGTNNEDPPKLDDEKNFQSDPQQSHSPSVALNPEDGLINPTVEDTVEQNIKSREVSMDILTDDKDSVIISKETAVVHGEAIAIPDTKVSEDKESPRHHTNIVMEQDKAAEDHDMMSSGDHDEIPVNPDTKLSEVKGSPQHHASTVMEQDKAAEEHGMLSSENLDEFPVSHDTKLLDVKGSPHHNANTVMELDKTAEKHEIISSGDRKELPNPDTKVVEEIVDRLDADEANNINLAPVNHDQGTTTELDEEPEVPCSDIAMKLENMPSEPLIETSMTAEKEPDIPATEYLTDNEKTSDVLAVGVLGESDKGLCVLPATQTSSDHDERITTTLEAEPKEDMKHDVPDSKLVVDATVDPPTNKDVNVEANTEKIDNCRAPEVSDADNESAPERLEPGPPCVASSNIKSETRVSGDLNNGVRNIVLSPPGYEGTISASPSFLLDDTSEGNESGTEEDQSDFMKELYRFFKERNMEFKPPKFYGEGLNCLKLWRAVTRLGGYDKVTGSKLWRQVGESFRPPKTCTTVSWTFRGFYEKALLEYERHKVSGGELQMTLASELEPMNIDSQASGSGRARRDSAARAMQGWHSQRLNGNSEASDSAIKDKNLVVHPKREKQIGTNQGLLKRKRPTSTEHGAKHAIKVSRPMLDVTVADVGPPADWVKINVRRTDDCFEVYALVPGLVREEVRVQSDPAGRLVISGEPENPMNPWGATPFKKVVSLPTRIDPHHTSAVVTLNGQLFVRVPIEQVD